MYTNWMRELRYFTPTLHWYDCCVCRWLTLHIVLRVVVIYLFFPLLELLDGQANGREVS